jgi:hypothetical protein
MGHIVIGQVLVVFVQVGIEGFECSDHRKGLLGLWVDRNSRWTWHWLDRQLLIHVISVARLSTDVHEPRAGVRDAPTMPRHRSDCGGGSPFKRAR